MRTMKGMGQTKKETGTLHEPRFVGSGLSLNARPGPILKIVSLNQGTIGSFFASKLAKPDHGGYP